MYNHKPHNTTFETLLTDNRGAHNNSPAAYSLGDPDSLPNPVSFQL
jgi:hypothetical protein